MTVLEVENLSVHFQTEQGIARAVDGVSFQIEKGKTHVLVGESGSGKSVTALAIMGLLSSHNTILPSGRVLFDGKDLLRLSGSELRGYRGSKISMIFQEPMTALNPVMRVGDQILEALRIHGECLGKQVSRRAYLQRVYELMEQTGLRDPEQLYRKYPHELSGGMRQRIMIAIALACRPSLIIADEPTTALDVTIQAQILGLMRDLQESIGASILMITHDLGVAAQMGHFISVMYAGQIVEQGPVQEVLKNPCHPYTISLLEALLSRNLSHRGRLNAIPGNVPAAYLYDSLSSACRFYERCPFQDDRCFKKSGRPDHWSRCAREGA